MNQFLAEHGIENLGGDLGGLNLEFEYYDLEGNYREAVYAIHDIDTLEIITVFVPSKHEIVLWVSYGDDFSNRRISFPKGCHKFVDIRLPAIGGGQSIVDRIVQGSPNES